MEITIIPNENTNAPAGKLADAELHFTDGALEGLKLIGFAIWESRGGSAGRLNVTFPARQYSVNGERRSFALLRTVTDSAAAGPPAPADSAGLRRLSAADGARQLTVPAIFGGAQPDGERRA